MDRFITVAIHTYEKAIALRSLLEREGLEVQFRNVNIEQPVVSSGIRVRIRECDLPLALRIIENQEIFADPLGPAQQSQPELPIVVPTDFSDNSLESAKTAIRLAEAHSTSIVLLHTYIDPYTAGAIQLTNSLTYELGENGARQQAIASAKAQMRHFGNRLKEMIKQGELPLVGFETCVTEGVPEDAITQYTKSNNPFLIVMGTRGTKKKEEEMIGSVTAEVLDKCRFSVLALPEPLDTGKKPFEPKRILFFSNADQEDILAVDTLYRIFPKANARVTIALLPGKKRLFPSATAQGSEALCNYCNQNFKGYTFCTAPISPNASTDDLRRLEEASAYDLLVIPNKKKNAFSRFFNPSLAHRVLFAADIPMLVIPV